tara:strand:- start:1041 stop:1211 length:171 start_codon:yes stop_codon:yes gene_type:complete
MDIYKNIKEHPIPKIDLRKPNSSLLPITPIIQTAPIPPINILRNEFIIALPPSFLA